MLVELWEACDIMGKICIIGASLGCLEMIRLMIATFIKD